MNGFSIFPKVLISRIFYIAGEIEASHQGCPEQGTNDCIHTSGQSSGINHGPHGDVHFIPNDATLYMFGETCLIEVHLSFRKCLLRAKPHPSQSI